MKSLAFRLVAFSALALVAASACGSDMTQPPPPPPPPPPSPAAAVTAVELADDADRGDASDLTVTFSPAADETGIKEYRAIVVPAAGAGSFTKEDADGLAPSRFFTVARGGARSGIRATAGLLDASGGAIVDGNEYRAFVLSVPDSVERNVSALSPASQPTELAPNPAVVAGTPFVDDFGNDGDARDLSVSFPVPRVQETVSEYRVVLLKEPAAATFMAEAADVIPASAFATAVPVSDTISVSFDSTATDTDGDPVVEGTSYRVMVVSIPDGTFATLKALSAASAAITLAPNNIVRTLVGTIAASGGVAVDATGNVFVADYGISAPTANGTLVFRVTPAGDVTTFATGFSGAAGNEFDAAGDYYQSNIAAGTVTRITTGGTRSDFATGIAGPTGIAFDGNGTMYVNQCGAGSVMKMAPSGQVSGSLNSSSFNCPNGITIDESDNVYVCSFNNGILTKVAPSGAATSLATVPGGVCGHIVYNGNGTLYLAAYAAQQIYSISTSGANLKLIAGSGTRGQRDGSAERARLSLPNGLALSPDGTRLYFNDSQPLTGPNVKPNSLRYVELVTQ